MAEEPQADIYADCRSELERYYVLAPPSTIQRVCDGHLAEIWRWESGSTPKLAMLYALFWVFDIVPALVPLALLYQLLKSRLFPPTPEELLFESITRTNRDREAHELSRQLKVSGRIGFAAESVRGKLLKAVGKLEDEDEPGTTLAKGLEGSALLGGLAGGLLDRDVLARARAMRKQVKARSPSGFAKAVNGGPPGLEETGSDENVSLYQIMKQVSKVIGPFGQEMLHQGADLGEMLKKSAVCSSRGLSALLTLVTPSASCFIPTIHPSTLSSCGCP